MTGVQTCALPIFFKDMGMPELNIANIKNVRKTVRVCIETALYTNPGPVHLNFPFDKPFEPNAFTDKITPSLIDFIQNNSSDFSSSIKPKKDFAYNKKLFKYLISDINKFEKGIIIIGPEYYRDDFHKTVVELADKLNYPILADGASQLRFNAHSKKNIISNYDAIFRSKEFSKKHKPDIILHFGRTVTSKGLEDFIEIGRASCRERV